MTQTRTFATSTKSEEHNTGKGWMGRLHDIFVLKEGFRQGFTYMTIMEAGKQRTEKENVKLDGKFLNWKRNDNSVKEYEIEIKKNVGNWVPQGSALAPVLFLVYTDFR